MGRNTDRATGGPEGDVAEGAVFSRALLHRITTECLDAPEVIRTERYELDPEDLRRLGPGYLLNDRVINAYFELLAEHSQGSVYVFSTFFYSTLVRRGVEWVQRWTCRTNIFRGRLIYIPVHLPGHWVLVVVDLENMVLEYYDSACGVDRDVVHWIGRYLKAEWSRIHSRGLRLGIAVKRRIPLQKNGYDCGVFVCMFGRYRLEGSRDWFSSSDVQDLRKMMVHEIVAGRILYSTSHLFETDCINLGTQQGHDEDKDHKETGDREGCGRGLHRRQEETQEAHVREES